MRQRHRRLDRLIQDLDLVVLFQHPGDAAQHLDGGFFRWLLDLHHLKTPGQGGVFFDMLFIFRPGGGGDRAQFAACQRRFQQVGGVAGARRPARADQCMGFVNEQDDRPFRRLHLVNHRFQPFFELALDRGPGLHQPDIQHVKVNRL